ncbi:DUF6528 family protein [Ruania albidiflava]|uniref:DUF6528 family protein n=1 Tax=Ruania albidiflava TaxID=366586 RepID=UPI0003B6696A|nr:DUF6528 family protein [Ruania albidiflava]
MRARLSISFTLAAGVLLSLPAAAAAGSPGIRTGTTTETEESAQMPTTPIVLTEQAEPEILVMDPTADWSTDEARLWAWSPGPDSDLNAPDEAWYHPDDARLRTDERTGEQFVMVSDSFGLLAQVPYPAGGRVAWSVDGTHEASPHGIELLPDGNVAAAASGGDWVRIYTASQGRDSEEFVEAELIGAHQVLWSDQDDLLWALGDDELVTFEIGGTPAEPSLERTATYDLPTSGGHDLQPVSGDQDRVWVTTVYSVFQFVKSEQKWDLRYPRYDELYRVNVKSIGTDAASGTVLETAVQPENPCGHCTDHVDLFTGTDGRSTLTLPDSEIYRARWFDEESN